jgi:uncharacterized protein YceK
MRPILALLALAPLLSGCSTKYDLTGADWTKPGTMLTQTTLDEMDCVRAAREAGWTPDLILGGLIDVGRWTVEEKIQRRSAYRRCMTARGYQPS